MDDEEEEEAIYALQDAIGEIQNSLGIIELNLNEGTNDIEANCPTTEEIVQEVITNITTTPEPENNNVTEPLPAVCPFIPEQNVTEPVVEPPTTVITPPVQNLTCPFAPVEQPTENNVTEVVEEIIENVTGEQEPICNIPQNILPPGIVLPNVTEPIVVVEEPVQNVTEPIADVPICNITGQPIIVEPLPVPVPETPTNNGTTFDVSCGCFVIDKTPEEIELGIGNPEDIETGLYY